MYLKSFNDFKKKIGINFWILVVGLSFLPAQTYYQTLQNKWQTPKVNPAFELNPPSFYPVNSTGQSPPSLSAKGILVIDIDSSVRILTKNTSERFPPASTTKMMTALVALEHFNAQDVLTVPDLVDEGQDIELAAGEKMTLENLLYALLVASANDAAETIAFNFPGGRLAFVEKMNQKASELSLLDTHFVNPTGIDQQGQYSSPFDLALVARAGLKNPEFAQIVRTQKIEITSVDGKLHKISNINQLLGRIPGVAGVKTGWTDQAGECLVTYVERDDRKILIVLLGSKDRFGETKLVIDWVFSNFQWVEPELNY